MLSLVTRRATLFSFYAGMVIWGVAMLVAFVLGFKDAVYFLGVLVAGAFAVFNWLRVKSFRKTLPDRKLLTPTDKTVLKKQRQICMIPTAITVATAIAALESGWFLIVAIPMIVVSSRFWQNLERLEYVLILRHIEAPPADVERLLVERYPLLRASSSIDTKTNQPRPPSKEKLLYGRDNPHTYRTGDVVLCQLEGTAEKTRQENIRHIQADTDLERVVYLVREHDHPYDSNSTRVEHQGRVIGYLPKALAAAVAPQIDAANLSIPIYGFVFDVSPLPDQNSTAGVTIMFRIPMPPLKFTPPVGVEIPGQSLSPSKNLPDLRPYETSRSAVNCLVCGSEYGNRQELVRQIAKTDAVMLYRCKTHPKAEYAIEVRWRGHTIGYLPVEYAQVISQQYLDPYNIIVFDGMVTRILGSQPPFHTPYRVGIAFLLPRVGDITIELYHRDYAPYHAAKKLRKEDITND